MIIIHAAWILPIAGPPIRSGWIAVDRGRILALGGPSDPVPTTAAREIDAGATAILPGLVNAHTHLELSYLRDTIAPQPAFVPWVRQVIGAQRARTDPSAPTISSRAAIDAAIAEAWQCGTAAVGDISNTLVTVDPLAASPIQAVVFHELLGFRPDDAEGIVERACLAIDGVRETGGVRVSLAAHAPYSVAPELFRAIRRAMDDRPHLPLSVHLAESKDEVEFLRDGTGEWRGLLEEVGAWNPQWMAPGVSPIAYLADAGFLDARTLAVHGVQAASADLERLAATGATLVTCPRSNGYTGAGRPPVEAFYASGVRVAVGTDSLASAPDLNVFAELAALRQIAPDVPASVLLDSATRQGARALGLEADLGTIAPGRSAALIGVRISPAIADVEEYLVNGVAPADIRWVHEMSPE